MRVKWGRSPPVLRQQIAYMVLVVIGDGEALRVGEHFGAGIGGKPLHNIDQNKAGAVVALFVICGQVGAPTSNGGSGTERHIHDEVMGVRGFGCC